ncbi:MAG: hypothetical protein M3128_04240 [Verrucomicrobiota bacterium]|nr:hypothetical protein [Verrucomicrobiota bacterium]
MVRIEPGNHDPKVAYLALNAYRAGDDKPMIARSGDGGATWQSVVGEGLPNYAPVEVIPEDPANPRLLYAGTHFGLCASFDQGAKWMRLGDVPAVRVDDLQIHPRTAGAGFFWLEGEIRNILGRLVLSSTKPLYARSAIPLTSGFLSSNSKTLHRRRM